MLEDYDIIEKVNGIKCNTIEEYRKAIVNKKGKYIEILTELNKKAVLEVPRIIEEETIFSNTYKYQISEIFKKNKIIS